MGNILVFCAHSDDESVGLGGTIQKFVKEGKKIIKIVFSFGESSHPHFKEDYVVKSRVEETEKASKFLGISENFFLGLKDGKIKEEVLDSKNNVSARIKEFIKHYDPERIYIPSEKDPHWDHRAVNTTVLEVVVGMKKKYAVYEYEVWNIVKENKPMHFVDITKYYQKKVQYMKMFKSQWQYMYALWLPVYIRSRLYGRKQHCKFAEKFYKVR